MAETLIHFHERALSFQSGAQLLNDSGLLGEIGHHRMRIGAGLLAIHGAIAYGDAAMVVLTGKHIHPQQHDRAAEELRIACVRANRDATGTRQFAQLLAKKNAISYDNRRVDADDVKSIIVQWERFCAWIARTFPELQSPEPAAEG